MSNAVELDKHGPQSGQAVTVVRDKLRGWRHFGVLTSWRRFTMRGGQVAAR